MFSSLQPRWEGRTEGRTGARLTRNKLASLLLPRDHVFSERSAKAPAQPWKGEVAEGARSTGAIRGSSLHIHTKQQNSSLPLSCFLFLDSSKRDTQKPRQGRVAQQTLLPHARYRVPHHVPSCALPRKAWLTNLPLSLTNGRTDRIPHRDVLEAGGPVLAAVRLLCLSATKLPLSPQFPLWVNPQTTDTALQEAAHTLPATQRGIPRAHDASHCQDSGAGSPGRSLRLP